MSKEHICVQTGTTCGFPCYDGCTRHKECGIFKESKLERDNRIYGNVIWWFIMIICTLHLGLYFYLGDLC